MCEAATATMVLTSLSTAATVYGAYNQAQNAKAIGNFNQNQANLAATDAVNRGVTSELLQREKVAKIAGMQTAQMGASGAAVESSSFENVADTTSRMGALDELTIRANAQREAWGIKQSGMAAKFQSDVSASNAMGSMWGSIITGGSSIYDKGWKSGVWGGKKSQVDTYGPAGEG